jgi:hypothetical protein
MASSAKSDEQVTFLDGSLDWSGGVNSILVTTVASERTPHGLKRNQLAWLNNATLRGGGITQRPGWPKNGVIPAVGTWQYGIVYQPNTEAPYIICVIEGHVWKVDVDNPAAAVDLSVQFNLFHPVTERCWFVQAEQFIVIQAGDAVTLPLIWDGTTLRRSLGITLGNETTAPAGLGTDVGVIQTNLWVMPNVGDPVTVILGAPYPGAAAGETVYFLLDFTENPPGGYLDPVLGATVASHSGVGATWLVTASATADPNDVTLQLVSYASAYAPGNLVATGTPIYDMTVDPPDVADLPTSEIPPATCMAYYMGRLWYAQGRKFCAGDIVGGSSGTQQYQFRDSVLKVTENPLAIGGDGFSVPSGAGNIRSIFYAPNINTQLGQGPLYISTREAIYQLQVPVNRTSWIAADSANQPVMVLALSNGTVNDLSIVPVNQDIFFQSFEPSIRSFSASVRNFQQWGNVPLSVNEQRIMQFNDRNLMRFSSGIYFDNRLLQTALPYVTPIGTAHSSIVPLNFDLISTLEQQLPPVWEGMYQGLAVLQLMQMDYLGRPRAFIVCWSDREQQIQLWEISESDKWDDVDSRVGWYIEYPAFTWNREMSLKKLVSAELWLDRLLGTVEFFLDYRPDGDPCWYPWYQWKACSAKDTCEASPLDQANNPACIYPQPMRESYRQTVTLPQPPIACEHVMGRPAFIGYQFQCRLTIKGFCRIRGFFLHGEPVDRALYASMVCPPNELEPMKAPVLTPGWTPAQIG